MGKCSGLKGGGHHRKAIDLAGKKKKEKDDRKKKQEAVTQRAMAMKEILNSPHADCDIYLMATDGGGHLCRSHFRYEDCSNRRCKLSHRYTIAEALNTIHDDNNNNNDDDDDVNAGDTPSIPALQFFPGISRRTTMGRRRRWKIPSSPQEEEDVDKSVSTSQKKITLEHALLEGSPVMNTIVSYLESDQDVIHLALSCRHLYQLVENCQDVQRRKYRSQQSQIYRRNQELLSSKAIAGRLQYAITHQNLEQLAPQNSGNSSNKKNNKKTNKHKSKQNYNPRSILIYDCENPQVFKNFQQAMLQNKLSATTLNE